MRDLIRDYHASGSTLTSIGTIAANSKTLTLDFAIDFLDRHGIFIPNAGPMCTLSAPSAPSISIGGGPSGKETYGYQIVALDGLGGGSAASAIGTCTTGPATLGGLGANGDGDGQLIYRASWLAINVQDVAGANGRYAVYRVQVPSSSGLQLGFIGIYSYTNTPFFDYGQAVKTPPPGVPAQPPAKPFAQSLVTTIGLGASTAQITLTDAASTDAVNVTVYHDDTDAILRAFADTSSLHIPEGQFGLSQAATFAMTNGRITGEGRQSVIRMQGSWEASISLVGDGITLQDVAFDGQKVAHNLVNFSGNDIKIEGTFGTSPLFGGISANNADVSKWLRNILLDRNEYTDCEYTYSLEGNLEDLRITNNRASFTDYNYASRGISLHNAGTQQGYTFPRRFTVSGNVLRCGNHSGAIVLQGCGKGTVSNNVMLSSGGVYGFWGIGCADYIDQCGEWTCTDNHIESLWQQCGVGVNLDNLANVTVGGNTIDGFGYAYQIGGYGGGALVDDPKNAVRMYGDNLINLQDGTYCGTVPQSVVA